jgi:hypothetical protein
MDFYISSKNIVDLLKDMIFFFGTLAGWKLWKDRKFAEISREIQSNLKFRKKIEPLLIEYFSQYGEYWKMDVKIKFLSWKSYRQFETVQDDFFSHCIFVERFQFYEKQSAPWMFIDDKGINFQKHIWFSASSVYLDENGIFFVDKKSKKFRFFKEIENCVMVLHLPYKNIIDSDFRGEYDRAPIFYTRYHCNQYKKLYSDKVVIAAGPPRKKDIEDYHDELYSHFHMNPLSQKNMLKKYSWCRYATVLMKVKLSKIIKSVSTDLLSKFL